MTKIQLFYAIFISITISISAQIPNGGFEDWADSNPVNWLTFDVLGIVNSVTQTNDSHSGNSAARMEVIEFAAQPFPPFLQSISNELAGFSISTRYESLLGYCKLSALGNDRLNIFVSLFNSTSGTVGFGQIYLDGAIPNFTQFSIPIEYLSNEIPESAIIQIVLSDSSGSDESSTIGSWAILDDLEFSGIATDVENNNQIRIEYALNNNYPNPFNPSTTISYSIPENGHIKLGVYDVLGNEVAQLVNGYKSSGNYSYLFDASNLTSGIYFYTIRAGNFVETKKMLLMK